MHHLPRATLTFDDAVGEFVAYDLFASDQLTDNIRVNLGINNLLDEQAPIILSGVTSYTTATDTSASIYNSIGRSTFVGTRTEF